jgi:(E)-4-hydroxy-3-methylbut-2-enyl-diphosphate synthase
VRVGFEVLKSLGLRHRGVNLIACPSCARQKFNVIDVVSKLEERVAHIHQNMDVAVIGCVVNGPGEAKEAHMGITGGYPTHLMYRDGEKVDKVESNAIVDLLVEEIEQRAEAIRQHDDGQSI